MQSVIPAEHAGIKQLLDKDEQHFYDATCIQEIITVE